MIGIYKINNKVNNKIYIGSSSDIQDRWRKHRSVLNRDINESPHLQNAWNKYGEESFVFEILLLCEEFELLRYEQWFLDNVVKWGVDYNIAECAESSMRGYKHTNETKEKMAMSHKGSKHTEETKRKISKANTGRIFSEEHKRNLSISLSKLRPNRVILKPLEKNKVKQLYYKNNTTHKALSKIFKVSESTIRRIINEKTRRHI